MMRYGLFFGAMLLCVHTVTPALGHEHVKPIRGEIVKIDQTANVLIVKAGKDEVTLYLMPDTAVRSGKAIKLAYEKDAFAEFAVGERIGVSYITDAQGKKLAHSILKLKQDTAKKKK
jgi:hypothetical protein